MIRGLALSVATVVVAACSDSTAPEAVSLDDVLSDLAQVEAYSALGATAGGVPRVPMQSSASADCAFTASSQTFVCAPVTFGGMTMNRSFQLLDASGAPLATFTPASVASIKTVVDLAGTPSGGGTPGVAVSITHHSEQTVGGLLSTTRTIDGTATSRFIVTSAGQTDTVTSTTTTALTLRATGPEPRYPAGTVETRIDNPGVPGAISVTTSFNGTSTATVAVTIGGFTSTCTMNLAQPSQPPSCS